MAPVELVVSEGPHSAGKATDDDCALCDLFGAFNDAEDDAKEEEEGETQEEEAEMDSTASEGGPDLIVQSPSVSAVTLTPGQAFTLNVTVHNQGDAAGRGDDAALLSLQQCDDHFQQRHGSGYGRNRCTGCLGHPVRCRLTLTAPTGVSAERAIYYGACVASVSGDSNTDPTTAPRL